MNTDSGDVTDDEELVHRPHLPPSEGERRAVSGYQAQYHVSGSLILQSLREQRLEWIRVADPEALRVDDLLLGSQGRVDAYQVKWSQYAGTFTFLDLTAETSRAPSLIAQLAQGWQQLKENYPGQRVVVHLVTNNHPSTSKQANLPVGEVCPSPSTFAAFLAQAWEPAHDLSLDESIGVSEEWLAAWDALRTASLLAEEEFQDFVRDCELDLEYQFPHSSASKNTRDEQIAAQDIEAIAGGLTAMVTDPKRIVEFSRDQFLKRLGWSHRFEFKSLHHFPIDEALYQPIASTAQDLIDAIDALPGGYIALLGSPGSGKSTLLTKTLRSLSERLVSYYAYVPESPYPTSIRGESSNFFHDVVLRLEELGFSVGKSPSRFDHNQLVERFYQQLGHLHTDWSNNGRKTVFLVDGLDHIEREQEPSRSLLLDLPDPDQVPDGVYVILGTQTDAPLSARIQATVRRPHRRIEIQPLERRQMYKVINAANLQDEITSDQQDIVYDLSSGHPLALTYLLRQIDLSDDKQSAIEYLQENHTYGGDIEATYQSYWTQFSSDADLCDLLSRLARIRGAIDLSWVRTWAADSVVERLGRQFAHYFRIESSSSWHFFHNSFRLFLVEKTSEFPAGTYDSSRNISYHNALADLCASSQSHPVQAWEELYHRFSAEQHEQVLELTTQEYFRRQFFNLRPLDAIHTDILIALRSAEICRNPIGLARLCLIGSEMRQREYHFQQMPLVSLLLGLGEQEIALEQLRSGRELRAPAGAALEAALMLLRYQGLEEESRRIFEIAEPFELMSGSPSMVVGRGGHEVDLLENWACLAILFRDLEEVIDAIRRVEYADSRSTDSTAATYSVQARLLFASGLELLKSERWSDLSILLDAFESKRQSDFNTRFWLYFHIYKDREDAGDKTRASQHLDEMLRMDERRLGPGEMTALAEGVYRLLGNCEQAIALIEDVAQPQLRADLTFATSNLEPFFQRFRLNRLLYALGQRRAPSTIVPDPADPKDRGLALFEKGLCTIAHIWARAWMGQTMNRSGIESETLPLLRFFCRSFRETQDWASWHVIKYTKAEFYKLLVQAVALHGNDALEALWQTLEKEWKQPDFGRYWTADDRRPVIQAFTRNGFSQKWAREQLRELNDAMLDGMDPSARVEECMRHAKARLELGDHKQARHYLNSALEVGIGVGYRKDFQMNEWVRWLGRINTIEPEGASQRILMFAGAIESLGHSTEGPAASSAAERLLAMTFNWSPVSATQLSQWLLERRVIGHQAVIRTLLIEALKAPHPPVLVAGQVIRDLVIPFESGDNLSILPAFFRALSRLEDDHRVIEEVRSLADSIRLYGNPGVRPKWLSQLKRAIEDVSLSSDVACLEGILEEDPEDSRLQDTLTLGADSESLTTVEVEERVSSVDDVRELLEAEADDSFFDWLPVVVRLADAIDDEELLVTLAELFRSRRHSSQVLAHICTRLSGTGSRETAWEIGLEALETSSEYGWNPVYDGGTRVLALRALAGVDENRATSLAYETLLRDLRGYPLLVSEVASNLYDILSLLNPTFSIAQAWCEIEEHTAPFLCEGSSTIDLEEFGPTDLSNTPQTALVQLTAAQLDHSCQVLAQASQRSLGKLIVARTSEVADVLKCSIDRSENHQERILMLLDAVSLTDCESILDFRAHVEALAYSPNWSLRAMALSIIQACGWDTPVRDSLHSPLPKIYELSLPPRTLDVRDDALPISSGEPIPDSEDPHLIVSPFNSQIELISQVAGVPERNTRRRIVDIMHSLGPRESMWSAQAERQLRSWLSAVGIRLPFVRPRARYARRAMFHAVAELIDAGRIPCDALRSLEAGLRTYDPRMVLAEPSPRPNPLQPIADLTFGVDMMEWIEGVAEALNYTDWSTSEGALVLAEKTHFRGQRGWDAPSEERYSLLRPANCTTFEATEVISEPERIFGETVKGLIAEYPRTDTDSEDSAIVVRNLDYGYESPGANWLALDPAIALQMGWSPSSDGMFRWVGSNDQLMVESIWWTDGLLSSFPLGHKTGAVGGGWFVVASQCGAEAIRREFGPMHRKSIVTRRIRKDGEAMDRSAVSQHPV